MDARKTLETIWWAGVNRVRGDRAVAEALADGKGEGVTHIAAVGKAASPMMRMQRSARNLNSTPTSNTNGENKPE